jgi:hypothetical protein
VQPATEALQRLLASDTGMVVWWATELECVSALAKIEREGIASHEALAAAFSRLDSLAAAWHEVPPADNVRVAARRILRTHALRAGDALQLAAALTASEGRSDTLPFVSLDLRLAEAAEREGFVVAATA